VSRDFSGAEGLYWRADHFGQLVWKAQPFELRRFPLSPLALAVGPLYCTSHYRNVALLLLLMITAHNSQTKIFNMPSILSPGPIWSGRLSRWWPPHQDPEYACFRHTECFNENDDEIAYFTMRWKTRSLVSSTAPKTCTNRQNPVRKEKPRSQSKVSMVRDGGQDLPKR